ncbi:cellulose binding domain-containing protein [Streptomyces albogriseolus]|uniref:cellulose binding domain-containing protein n=1 Tax=Streptomyces albogriseolus TaxID=1887 RepID=UPI003EC096B6
MEWSRPDGRRATGAWNATVTQSGTAVVARNVERNRMIAAGGTASFGVQGSLSGGAIRPPRPSCSTGAPAPDRGNEPRETAG